MAGLRMICKLYGGMRIDGVEWVWDYHRDKPVLKSKMTHEDWILSEKARWEEVAKNLSKTEGDTK